MITPVDVMIALAQHLDTAGIAQYNPSGAYSEGLPAVVFGQMPDTPDSVIVINHATTAVYRAGQGAPDINLHIRYRTAGQHPHTTERLAQAVFELIEKSHQQWGTVTVRDCARTGQMPLLIDSNNRYTRADSYRAHINF